MNVNRTKDVLKKYSGETKDEGTRISNQWTFYELNIFVCVCVCILHALESSQYRSNKIHLLRMLLYFIYITLLIYN